MVIVSLLLNACFFVPSMNLPLGDQPLMRTSEVGNVKINLYPIDQHVLKYPMIYGVPPKNYTIGARDLISVSIWGHPEFTSTQTGANNFSLVNKTTNTSIIGSSYGLTAATGVSNDNYVVDNDGDINVLFAGDIHVSGLDTAQVRKKVEQSLKDYIANPQAKVTVTGFRSRMVYVFGEVQQSQMLPITDIPLNLTSALELAGWVNLTTANVNQIYVLRLDTNKSVVSAFWLDGGTVAAMLFAQSFYLQNNDIVYVSTAGLSQFNRVMTQLLPFAEVWWYTKTALPSAALPGILN